MANKKKKSDKELARERAKQIEKMMEDKETPDILKWFYANRNILIIALVVIILGIIGVAVFVGIKEYNQTKTAEVYLEAYEILRDFDEKKIIELEESDLGKLKKELNEVIQKTENMLFKSYEFRLANYYLGLITYSQKDYKSSVSYFKKASEEKSFPIADIAYFNMGKSYEQMGYLKQNSDEEGNQNKDLDTAINHYLNMEKKFPNSFLTLRAKYQAALIYEYIGQYDKALDLLNKIKEDESFIKATETEVETADNQNQKIISETRTFVENVDNAIMRLKVISQMDISETTTTPIEKKENNQEN